MSTSRSIRAVRATLAAAVSTGVALASHVFAGGDVPTAIGIIAPFALSVLVALVMVGRSLKLWRVATVVVGSQALFHWLFVLGSPSGVPAPSTGVSHHSLVGTMQLSAHAMTAPAMGLGHIVAALFTIVLLYRGEHALRSLAQSALGALARIAWIAPLRIADTSTLRVITIDELPARTVLIASVGRRGPPRLV